MMYYMFDDEENGNKKKIVIVIIIGALILLAIVFILILIKKPPPDGGDVISSPYHNDDNIESSVIINSEKMINNCEKNMNYEEYSNISTDPFSIESDELGEEERINKMSSLISEEYEEENDDKVIEIDDEVDKNSHDSFSPLTE